MLQNYNYQIVHRSGKGMGHVDALSRCQNVLVLHENTLEQNLAFQQSQDKAIIKIRDYLEHNEHNKFELNNGLVYRKKDKKILFFVPESMENSVIKIYHDEMGHFGVDKVIELITRSYWFQHMKDKIKNYVRNCLKCIVYSPNSGKREGELHSIDKGNVPFSHLHIDHYGPLQKTSAGFKYIFEVVCGFTKFIKLYPCKTTNSKEAIKHLTNYFRHYSQPIKLISDRGTGFTSNLFEEFLEKRGIQHILIATGTPRANGQIERFNRDITPVLAKITPELHKWDTVLDRVEFAFNNTFCRSIKNTPSRLLFGVDQQGEILDALKFYLDESDKNRNLVEIRDSAAKAIGGTQAHNKELFDARHKAPRRYKEGDYVMIVNTDVTPGINKKLLPKYRGPYEVKKVLPNDRYVIADVDGYQITGIPFEGVFESGRMRPWQESSNSGMDFDFLTDN